MFNSIDKHSSGFIDFRDFIAVMGILKCGNIEERLQLAFRAYDLNNNGFIEKVRTCPRSCLWFLVYGVVMIVRRSYWR